MHVVVVDGGVLHRRDAGRPHRVKRHVESRRLKSEARRRLRVHGDISRRIAQRAGRVTGCVTLNPARERVLGAGADVSGLQRG